MRVESFAGGGATRGQGTGVRGQGRPPTSDPSTLQSRDCPPLGGGLESEPDPHEHFVEERWVSRRLFEERSFGGVIVDPCAGFGNVVRSARACGLWAYGSDVVKRSPLVSGEADFLSERWRPPRRAGAYFSIVGNPPFGERSDRVRAFAEAAAERTARFALLCHVERLNALMKWAEPLGLCEVLAVTPRPSMWPGAEYRRRIAAGEKLGTGRRGVVWLLFRYRHSGGVALSRLWRDG